jgi:hypothetical protein
VSEGWTLTPHVCRHCGIGRVLKRENLVRCSLCGVEAKGNTTALCACGVQGYRCAANATRTPANPYEYLPQMVAQEPKKPKPKPTPAPPGGLFG